MERSSCCLRVTLAGSRPDRPSGQVHHHAAFIHRRHAQRPSEEYRAPTTEEWTEFEQHFIPMPHLAARPGAGATRTHDGGIGDAYLRLGSSRSRSASRRESSRMRWNRWRMTSRCSGPAGDLVRPVVGAWRGLGLSEAQHRRVVDYLTGVLWAMDLLAAGIAAAGRVFAGEAGR